jgi:DNA polymerase-1
MVLYLVDGNSYFHRAFHAIKGLTNSRGFPTNAIYGFTSMIMKILKEKKPDSIAIAFDSKEPTQRHKIYEEYKAQRPETPSDLLLQIPYIKDIVSAFNIQSFEMPGYEADDIICTIAKKAAAEGANVFILSGDKDMMQAVTDGVKIYDPMKDIVIDEQAVIERFGVPPAQVPEVMAIAGDTVDNIPGVKGIGEKTAKELLSEAGSLDKLLYHPEKIKSERLRKMITENIEIIQLSKTLATIDTDVPVDISLRDFRLKEPDWAALNELFSEFEFKSLIKQIPKPAHTPRNKYAAITSADQLILFLEGKEKS